MGIQAICVVLKCIRFVCRCKIQCVGTLLDSSRASSLCFTLGKLDTNFDLHKGVYRRGLRAIDVLGFTTQSTLNRERAWLLST